MAAAVLAAVLLLAGCVGYRLGNTLPAGMTVYVPVFRSECLEPQLETETTRATIRTIQTDGSLHIANDETATSILSVTLKDFQLEPVRYDKDDAKRTKEYRMNITADFVFRMSKSGQVLAKKTVVGKTTFLEAGDLMAAKRLALPRAAEDLAHQIVKNIVEYW